MIIKEATYSWNYRAPQHSQGRQLFNGDIVIDKLQVECLGEVHEDYDTNIVAFVRTMVKMMEKALKTMAGGYALSILKLVDITGFFFFFFFFWCLEQPIWL